MLARRSVFCWRNFFILMICFRPNILELIRPIYTIILPNGRYLIADYRSNLIILTLTLKDVVMANNFMTKSPTTPTLSQLHSETVWNIAMWVDGF